MPKSRSKHRRHRSYSSLMRSIAASQKPANRFTKWALSIIAVLLVGTASYFLVQNWQVEDGKGVVIAD